MGRSPITRDGYNQLHKELGNLKKVTRPQVIKAIEEARAHGDLSENAEYVAAKERQSFVEMKIREIEQKLANSEIMETTNLPSDRVGFASVVTLENLHNGEEVTPEIIQSRCSVVFDQAENRMHAQKALLVQMLGGLDVFLRRHK